MAPQGVVFPRASTIAARMGVSERTVRRTIRSLDRKGFVAKKRAEDGKSYYDLTPLKEKLAPIAAKKVEEKRQIKLLSAMLSPHGDT